MTQKELLEKLKTKLESQGTVFSNYYGTLIYQSGPKPSGFFKSINEGNYSVDVLCIPKELIETTINTKNVLKFLNEEL